MVCAVEASSFQTERNLTARCVDAAGDATTVVVVALLMLVLARLGVTVVPERSTHEA
jgi:hypothetical protein